MALQIVSVQRNNKPDLNYTIIPPQNPIISVQNWRQFASDIANIPCRLSPLASGEYQILWDGTPHLDLVALQSWLDTRDGSEKSSEQIDYEAKQANQDSRLAQFLAIDPALVDSMDNAQFRNYVKAMGHLLRAKYG